MKGEKLSWNTEKYVKAERKENSQTKIKDMMHT